MASPPGAVPVPSLAELLVRARAARPRRLAVAAAESGSALAAVAEAQRQGIAQGVLIGDVAEIRRRLGLLGEDPDAFEIQPAESDAAAARRAVALVRAGEAAMLMKGRLRTAELLHAVLDREHGLRTGALLSDVMVADHPIAGQARIVGITDGGVNVAPGLPQKKAILENAVELFHRLGYALPRVACLCAVETVSPAMPHTEEARAIARMNARGEIPGCLVSGPLALDNALSAEAARQKGIDDPVAGRADVLLCPAIEVANALGKAFTWVGHVRVGHLVVGARAPVIIPSRVDEAADKLNSIALGVLATSAGEEGRAA
jgi:phosphate butyryltransferase